MYNQLNLKKGCYALFLTNKEISVEKQTRFSYQELSVLVYFNPAPLYHYPVDTGRKLNVHKTFRRRPGRLLNVLYTFNLRPVSTGYRSNWGVCKTSRLKLL